MTKTICIAYQKNMAKSSTPETGDDVIVRANAFLTVSDYIADLFNIPVLTEASSGTIAAIKVAGSTYDRKITEDGSKVKKVSVPDYERDAGGGSRHSFKVVRLSDLTKPLNEAGTRFRTVSIRFPGFFSLLMLRQALGTMLKTKQPPTWKLDSTGKSYLWLPSEENLLPNRKSGAWVVTTPIATQNTEEANVGDNTVVNTPQKKDK